MELNEIKNEEFRKKGYIVIRNLLSPVEVETMRSYADIVAANIENYRAQDKSERQKILTRHPMPPFSSEGSGDPVKDDFFKEKKIPR